MSDISETIIGEMQGLNIGATLQKVEDEASARAELLKVVEITESGLAVCENPVSGAVMQIAGVRIKDDNTAVQVPFVRGENGKIVFPLPGDRLSQIGYFLGRNGVKAISAAVRADEYPGIPLITSSNVAGYPDNEIIVNLGGFKRDELDELNWADDVGLFGRLGFDPDYSRGFFSRLHRPDPKTDVWTSNRILAGSDGHLDGVVETLGPEIDVGLHQILGYETGAPKIFYQEQIRDSYSTGNFPPARFDLKGPTERTIGDNLNCGFAPAFQTSGNTSQISLKSLQAAIEVRVAADS